MAEKNNSKKRMIASVLLATIVVGGGGIYLLSNNSTQREMMDVGQSNVNTNLSNIQDIPGQSTDAQHNEIQKEANKSNYEKAKEEGSSFIPKLVNENVEKEEVIEQPEEKKVVEEIIKEPEPIVEEIIKEPEPVVEEKPIVQALPLVEQPKPEPTIKYEVNIPKEKAKEEVDEDLVALYQEEIQKLYAFWDKETGSEKGSGESLMKVEKDSKDEGKEGSVSSSNNVSSNLEQNINQDASANNGPLYVRATTIIPAVMMTSVNTDEPGPVMAEIVSGKLKGARLLGSVVNAPTDVTDNVQKATIQFTTIQRKDWDQSYSVNVFAVDPNTSRTALASSVDNHVFKRYGLGLAAAFLEGIGDAYANTGKSVTYTDSATVVSMATSAKQINRSALGNVGKKLGQEIGKIADVPATIYVDSGETIGLLFMADF